MSRKQKLCGTEWKNAKCKVTHCNASGQLIDLKQQHSRLLALQLASSHGSHTHVSTDTVVWAVGLSHVV